MLSCRGGSDEHTRARVAVVDGILCAVDVAAAKQLSHTATTTTNDYYYYYYYYYYYQVSTVVWRQRIPDQS